MENSEILYRRNGKKVYIKQPEFEELELVAKLWADEDTMKSIGGVFDFPKNKRGMFYKKMVYPSDGKNFYCLVYENLEGRAVGEVSFHGYDSSTKSVRFNIKINYKDRNKGYGQEALRLLLDYYFLDFGGKVVIDNVNTIEGMKLFKKVGFEILSQNKDEISVRLAKDEYSSTAFGINKKVSILMYDGINMLDYSIAHDILKIANDISDEKIFEINGISFQNKIKTNNGFTITTEKVINNGDIIIVPGGQNFDEELKVKEKIEYLNDNFKNCDFICAHGSGIEFLVLCEMLDGIFIPGSKDIYIGTQDIPDRRFIDKSFIDNGRIMLSSNTMGEIEMILRLIQKVGGKSLAKKVSNIIGFV